MNSEVPGGLASGPVKDDEVAFSRTGLTEILETEASCVSIVPLGRILPKQHSSQSVGGRDGLCRSAARLYRCSFGNRGFQVNSPSCSVEPKLNSAVLKSHRSVSGAEVSLRAEAQGGRSYTCCSKSRSFWNSSCGRSHHRCRLACRSFYLTFETRVDVSTTGTPPRRGRSSG